MLLSSRGLLLACLAVISLAVARPAVAVAPSSGFLSTQQLSDLLDQLPLPILHAKRCSGSAPCAWAAYLGSAYSRGVRGRFRVPRFDRHGAGAANATASVWEGMEDLDGSLPQLGIQAYTYRSASGRTEFVENAWYGVYYRGHFRYHYIRHGKVFFRPGDWIHLGIVWLGANHYKMYMRDARSGYDTGWFRESERYDPGPRSPQGFATSEAVMENNGHAIGSSLLRQRRRVLTYASSLYGFAWRPLQHVTFLQMYDAHRHQTAQAGWYRPRRGEAYLRWLQGGEGVY